MAGTPMPTRRVAVLVLLALTALPLAPRAVSAQVPPSVATAPVTRLNQALLDLMKSAGREPTRTRLQRFLPVMQETFDLEAALRVVAAPYFDGAGEAERRQALDAFTRRSAAQYVERFDNYEGQTIDLVGERPGPRGTTLVDTTLKKPGKDPVRLTYVMRQVGNGWKILDVLAKGTISQVATQRADFQTSLRSGGLQGLTRDLNANAEQLLGRS
ncbi:ABC transporter substrate-binding protein [Azospirillum sp. sgz301742]